MAEQQSAGISFTEPRLGAVTIPGAATAVAGMVGYAERGPLVPTLVSSPDVYQKIFGNSYAGSPLPAAVKDFFDDGGTQLWVQRVLHFTTITDPSTCDAVLAQSQVQGDGPASNFLLKASSLGGHGNALSVQTVRKTTQIATGGALAASAQTSYTISDVRRVRVGSTIRVMDSVAGAANSMRVKVTRIDVTAKKIYFASTTPTLAITIGNVFIEEFDVLVSRSGSFLERISNLSMNPEDVENYFKDVINNGDPVRQIVVATDNAMAFSNTVDNRPIDATYLFTLGSDGSAAVDTDYIGDAGSKTGLYAFDIIPTLTMIAIPGRTAQAVHLAVITYCEARQTVFGVLASPPNMTPTQVNTYVTTTANLFSERAAIYYPWVKQIDSDSGLMKTVSPEGHIMGMYARTDANRGVYKAPAGTPDGKLNNVLGLERTLTKTERDLIYPNNINPIISLPGNGICVYGSRTLSRGDFRHVPIRRSFAFVQMSLDAGTQSFVFEPCSAATRKKLKKSVTSFLLRQWRADGTGMLVGDKPTDAFFVICDETNNPPSVEAAGQMICRIGLALANPTEFLMFELVRDTRALDAELAAAGA